MNYKTLNNITLKNKRVLIREDFNVPMQNGKITDDSRILAALPTIQYALKQGAAVILMSHFGRPNELVSTTDNRQPIADDQYSLKPIAQRLSELLQKPVRFAPDWINGVTIKPSDIVLCENVRFLPGEKACDDALSKKMAALCDVFVMDAFATAHRAEASTTGVARFAKQSCAGLLLDRELTALTKALTHPKKPVVAIVGGAKVSTKLKVLDALLDKVNTLIVGGGIANTLLAASGVHVGNSLIEKEWIDHAKIFLQKAKIKNVALPLPIDVAVAKQFSINEKAIIKSVHDVQSDDMILDVGPATLAIYVSAVQQAKTIVWNGPVGVFEFPEFSKGTHVLASAIADSHAYSVAGGGDTLAAIAQCGVQDKISYLSTGGGAFLEWMEGKTLPGVAALALKSR